MESCAPLFTSVSCVPPVHLSVNADTAPILWGRGATRTRRVPARRGGYGRGVLFADPVVSQECSQEKRFSKRLRVHFSEKIRRLRGVLAGGARAPRACGAGGSAGGARAAGRGAARAAWAPALPRAAAAAVQFSGDPTGAAFAERIRRGGRRERARLQGQAAGEPRGGPGARGWDGRGERAGRECSPPLVSWVPSKSGSPWSPGFGAPVSSQGLGELGVG